MLKFFSIDYSTRRLLVTPLNERCTLREGYPTRRGGYSLREVSIPAIEYPTRRAGYPLREVESSMSGIQHIRSFRPSRTLPRRPRLMETRHLLPEPYTGEKSPERSDTHAS